MKVSEKVLARVREIDIVAFREEEKKAIPQEEHSSIDESVRVAI